jgi:hypothetical protein
MDPQTRRSGSLRGSARGHDEHKEHAMHLVHNQLRPSLGLRSVLATLALVLSIGCQGDQPATQSSFETPEAAVTTLLDAVARDDVDELLRVLGPESRHALVTPDWDAERDARKQITDAAAKSYELVELDGADLQLVIGEKQWPFPFHLAKAEGGWRFDTEQGIEELTDRRIGANELDAIAICEAYVDAQIEYAREDRNGDDVLEYAQRLASTPGKRDGLYWKAGPDEEQSPFGPLVAGAERYLATKEKGDPIKGYYFRILTRQGANVPGDAYDYIINGRMLAGFALVAYPADYGHSGVMTFVVNQRGKVSQKDIGPFAGMETYDPDDSWSESED